MRQHWQRSKITLPVEARSTCSLPPVRASAKQAWRSRYSSTSKPSAVASAMPSSATTGRNTTYRCMPQDTSPTMQRIPPLPRCARYLAETHGLVGQKSLQYARSLGLTTAHDGGYDQPFDPAKPGPAACTESERRMLTVKAGAPMPTAACGIDLLGPHCPQRGNCAHWIRRSRCGTCAAGRHDHRSRLRPLLAA